MNMAIQIEQRFPKCDRCGVMLHVSTQRLVALEGATTRQFCSELCRDEYAALTPLTTQGEWADGTRAGRRRLAS